MDEAVTRAVRKHLAVRRAAIAEKFPKNLAPEEYQKLVGRHEEVEALLAAVDNAVRTFNQESDDDRDAT